MTGRGRATAVLSGLLLLAAAPGAAHADYTGPQLISGTVSQQFDSADAPALAGDGQWAAFQGSVGGVPGVYRRNLLTGEVDLVAGSTAASPSISADGSEVAFSSSAAGLVPAGEVPTADAGCPQVYVRDMNLPAGAAGADTLASALSGTSTAITYSGCSTLTPPTGGLPATGAQAAPGVAMSADGSEVVFTVDSPSNLGLAPTAPVSTPASQVAVRDLDTGTTTIVSVTPQGTPTPDGGAYPSTPSLALHGGAENDGGIIGVPGPAASTAAISADGTTVAWMGTNVPAQVPSATEVTGAMLREPLVNQTDPAGQEVEPLWRRIADGPAATTVRLMAGAGLDFYDYQGYLNSQSLAIEGGTAEADAPGVPALSADGETVALTADAPPPSALPALAQIDDTSTLPYDAYRVQVSDAVGSVPQVTPLTAIPDYQANADDASVTSVAVSPDGDEVSLETARTVFALASPALITPPSQYDGFGNTYIVDLADATMQRVTTAYDGSLPDGSSGLSSFDDAGDLAAASVAGNLFYGDVNPLSPETYFYENIPVSSAVATGSISAPATPSMPSPVWVLSATASPQRNGTVLVRASVPGAGTLRARASAQLPRHPAAGRVAHAARSTPATAKPKPKPKPKKTKKTKKKHQRKPPPGTPVASRTVATARHPVQTASIVRLRLRLRRSDRTLATARAGLYAKVTVTFSAAGHSALVETVPVTFRDREPAKRTHDHRPHHGRTGGSVAGR